MNAKIIAVCNQKGGVGKTTTAINIGVALASLGKKVLLVDFDPQSNLTMSMSISQPETLPHTIDQTFMQVINGDPPAPLDEAILHVENVDMIPSSLQLSGVETLLFNTFNREHVLEELLEPLKASYDFILIDCAPSLGTLTINALTAADSVLIPGQAEYLSVKGLEMLLHNTIPMVKRRINKRLAIEGILITMMDGRTILAREMRSSIADAYGEQIRIFENAIPRSNKVKEASALGVSIFKHQPSGNAAVAYASVAGELLG